MRAVSKGKTISSRIFGVMALLGLLAGPALAEVSLKGHFIQGGMVIGQVEPGARVWADGRRIPLAPDGRFVLGFARKAAPVVRLKVRHADGKVERLRLKIAQRKYRVQRINGLPKRKVTPSKQDLARIRRDIAEVKAARAIERKAEDFTEPFIWPVTGPISGVYGSQRILNGKPRRPHMGVDIARPTGTRVVAPADGVVVFARPDLFFTGGTLIIDHGMRMNTTYCHLSKLLVKQGDHVRQGQPIGLVGATGRATGPHLHWGANVREVRIDPRLLVPPMPKDE